MHPDPALEQPRVLARDVVAHAALLRELDIPADTLTTGEAFLLVEREGRLELRPPGESQAAGVRAAFPPDPERPARGRNPLVRAFGKRVRTIFDLTAGFGADAYRLAEAGHRVVACERNAAVYAVLASGWRRDREVGRVPSELGERLSFSRAEGIEMLDRIEGPDVGIYLDPMYPQARRRRALPRRELQVLRKLHLEDADAGALLEAARERAGRVVVKRPHRAPPLAAGVHFEIASKLVRFDVYLNPRRSDPEQEVVRGRGGTSA